MEIPDPCELCNQVPAAGTCCDSHSKNLCHRCYRMTHFVEICATECPMCKAERLDPTTRPTVRRSGPCCKAAEDSEGFAHDHSEWYMGMLKAQEDVKHVQEDRRRTGEAARTLYDVLNLRDAQLKDLTAELKQANEVIAKASTWVALAADMAFGDSPEDHHAHEGAYDTALEELAKAVVSHQMEQALKAARQGADRARSEYEQSVRRHITTFGEE